MKVLLKSLLLFLSLSSSFAYDIVWFGAHPDDEIYVAPLLKRLCVEQGNTCHMIVLTLGESGKCHLKTDCTDLANIRRQEMEKAASIFNARLYQYDLGDGTSSDKNKVLENWINKLGGPENAFLEISNLFQRINPRFVFTFDPRNGVYCHSDHRASGFLSLAVLEKMNFPKKRVLLVESLPETGNINGRMWAGYKSIADTPEVLSFNVKSTWDSLIDVMNSHQSQFTPLMKETIYTAPSDFQKLYFLRWSDAKENDLRFNICS